MFVYNAFTLKFGDKGWGSMFPSRKWRTSKFAHSGARCIRSDLAGRCCSKVWETYKSTSGHYWKYIAWQKKHMKLKCARVVLGISKQIYKGNTLKLHPWNWTCILKCTIVWSKLRLPILQNYHFLVSILNFQAVSVWRCVTFYHFINSCDVTFKKINLKSSHAGVFFG